MKKNLLVITLSLAISIMTAGQSFGDGPKVINTQKTQQHKQIFEIPLLVALPLKSSLVNTPTGAADRHLGYTLDASVIYAPLELLIREFAEEKLSKRGLELKSYSEFTWNGARAALIKIFQPLGDGRTKAQWILTVDRMDHTWIASGAYDAKNQQSAAEVLEILKSAWWDKSEDALKVPEKAAAVIDTSGTPFRLAKISSGALIYTKDGKLPTESGDGAIFIASKINNAHIPADRQDEFAKEKCVRAALENELEIISEKRSAIKGKDLLEIVAKASDEEEEILIYQTMVFGVASGYNTMVGIAHNGSEEIIKHFRTLSENGIEKFTRQ